MTHAIFTLALVVFPVWTVGQVEIPKPSQVQAFSYEDKDWGVAPTSSPQGPPFGKPTPTSIPGARRINTLELKALLDANKQVVVIDVLDSKTRTTNHSIEPTATGKPMSAAYVKR